MNRIPLLLASITLALVATSTVTSCSAVQAQVQRIDPVKVGQLADIALTVAVASGKLSAGDAATIRAVGTIVLPPAPVPLPPPGKQPVDRLQP